MISTRVRASRPVPVRIAREGRSIKLNLDSVCRSVEVKFDAVNFGRVTRHKIICNSGNGIATDGAGATTHAAGLNRVRCSEGIGTPRDDEDSKSDQDNFEIA